MSRINEHRTSYEGKRMVVIEYLNVNNVTVMFEEDGSTQKTTYAIFKSGMVKKDDPKFDKKVDCKTYAWLRGLSDEKIAALDYDIVFFDECHGVVSNEEGKKARA